MAEQITLTKGKHTVTTTSAIEAENLKGIGYRVATKPATPAQVKPAQSTDKK